MISTESSPNQLQSLSPMETAKQDHSIPANCDSASNPSRCQSRNRDSTPLQCQIRDLETPSSSIATTADENTVTGAKTGANEVRPEREAAREVDNGLGLKTKDFVQEPADSRTNDELNTRIEQSLVDLSPKVGSESSEDVVDATRGKDAMRLLCIRQIAHSWFDISLAAATFDAMCRYIVWFDISLVANNAFLPLLFDLILFPNTSEPLRDSSAGCVLAAMRIEPHSKLNLLQSLQLNQFLAEYELAQKLPVLVMACAPK